MSKGEKIVGTDECVQLQIDAAEAEAALTIASRSHAGLPILEEHWLALLTGAGYLCWKRRMSAVGQPFSDADYLRFLLSSTVIDSLHQLRQTLSEWRNANWELAALRALDWLPASARICASIYLVLTPGANSFYYAEEDERSVFFALDPALTPAEFENRMVHELHHVGFFGLARCKTSGQLAAVQSAVEWTASFAEGMAMLAAAGGASVHPHAPSRPETRARWDREIGRIKQDQRRIENFLLDVVHGRMTQEEELQAGHALLGVQGPWYTVGWKMAATIERAYGKQALLDCMAEGPQLMRLYNQAAAAQGLMGWSPELISKL
jgi:hypothetical protein